MIKDDTTLAEILKYKGTKEVLAKFGVPCLQCPFAKQEMEKLKLKDICQYYGIDYQKLINELNKVIKEEEIF